MLLEFMVVTFSIGLDIRVKTLMRDLSRITLPTLSRASLACRHEILRRGLLPTN